MYNSWEIVTKYFFCKQIFNSFNELSTQATLLENKNLKQESNSGIFHCHFMHFVEAYSELSQTPKVELFGKIIKGKMPPTIFAKCSILNL